MSLLSKTMCALMPAVFPAALPAAQETASEIAKALNDFREQRAEDFAQLADRAGRSGVRLAQAQDEIERWRAYAGELEQICMAHGLPMPPAPDEP